MKNKTITLKEYNKRINNYNQLKQNGFKLVYKKNWFKIFLGIGCLIVAIIPNGVGFIFYPVGFYLLGISLKNILDLKRKLKNRILKRV